MNAPDSTSTRPYLIRALYEWCTDNGLTPYVAVAVDDTVQVPREYVKNQEIVLNISFDATSALKLGNDFIEFKARFAGSARDIMVPIERVIAIYARENGQGMAFPLAAQTLAGASSPGLAALELQDNSNGSLISLVSDVPAAKPADSGSSVSVGLHGVPSSDNKIVLLVPAEQATAVDDKNITPPEPPKPPGKRPSLKRVK